MTNVRSPKYKLSPDMQAEFACIFGLFLFYSYLHLLTELYEFDKIFLKTGTIYIYLCRYYIENAILGKEVNEKWI